jgi:RNA polymerase sigma factor (sigma-70 family)
VSDRRREYARLYHRKIASRRQDDILRQREAERLDEYGVATYQDPVQTPEEILLAKEDASLLVRAVDSLLWPRVILAIKMYYGIGCEPHTYEEIGELFDVTRERVRQIIGKGLRALKHPYRAKQLRPELYEKERARLDAAAKQAIADDKARVEREMQEARERQANRWHERHAEVIDAAARWERDGKERLKSKVVEFERRRRELRDLFLEAYDEAQYINSLWDRELLRREIAAEQARELEAKRNSQPKRRDWLWVASDRKQA